MTEKDTLKLKNDSQILIESSEGDQSKGRQLEQFKELLKDSAQGPQNERKMLTADLDLISEEEVGIKPTLNLLKTQVTAGLSIKDSTEVKISEDPSKMLVEEEPRL